MKDNLSDIENQLLVMDAQDGDVKAMEKLVSRWQRCLWQHAFRLTADQQAAWDITQQSWLGIIKGLRKLHDPANFKAWVYRIATNKSIDWLKRKSKDEQMNLDLVEVDCYEKKDDSGITELIQRLKDESRVVLSLYYFEQLNISEISIVLNIPQGTVKSRLHNARKELKELLQRHFE
jgi:RNA polymerase sigma-70 factor (ECF subfamily)